MLYYVSMQRVPIEPLKLSGMFLDHLCSWATFWKMIHHQADRLLDQSSARPITDSWPNDFSARPPKSEVLSIIEDMASEIVRLPDLQQLSDAQDNVTHLLKKRNDLWHLLL